MIKLLLILTISAHAAFIKDGDMIAPFELKNVPLESFLSDYADFMNVHINFTQSASIKGKVNLKINRKIGKKDLKDTFLEVLANGGYTADINNNTYWIYQTRDVRYMPSEITYGDLGEANASHTLYVYNLKYSLGKQIARNLRPFLSRYGRIIDVTNTNTVIISDSKKNIKKLKSIISRMDTKEAFNRLIESKLKRKNYRLDDYQNMKEENIELNQAFNALMDKKYSKQGERK